MDRLKSRPFYLFQTHLPPKILRFLLFSIIVSYNFYRTIFVYGFSKYTVSNKNRKKNSRYVVDVPTCTEGPITMCGAYLSKPTF